MAPTSFPRRLTAPEIVQMSTDSMVSIFVGTPRIPYRLPRGLLCHYSPFFNHYFNIRNNRSLSYNIPEDRNIDFRALVDYLLTECTMQFVPGGSPIDRMAHCMSLIAFAAKYGLAQAGDVVFEALQVLLGYDDPGRNLLQPGHVDVIFGVFPPNHRMRILAAQAAVVSGFADGVFSIQETRLDGFAVEVLRQLRRHKEYGFSFAITDPFTGDAILI